MVSLNNLIQDSLCHGASTKFIGLQEGSVPDVKTFRENKGHARIYRVAGSLKIGCLSRHG